ncbi:MAG: AAA family ATPase [Acidobacteria bacterium]|nr:AAA family ATPase [Acidobacteriota bacterium]
MTTTTLPPALQNAEAERTVIGAVLVNPSLLPSATLRPSDFAGAAHRIIWSAILKLDEAGTPIDHVTLRDALLTSGQLEASGGVGYVGSLGDGVPRISNVEAWVAIVRDRARLRAVTVAAERMLTMARSGTADAHEVLERGQQALASVAEAVGAQVNLDVATPIEEAIRDLEASARSEGRGFKTGIADLDRRIGQLLPGQVVLVAARTGLGKSTLLANLGDAIAAQGGTVLLISAEMSAREINRRRVLAEARVRADRFEPNGVTPLRRERDAIAAAAETLKERRFIVEASAPAPLELRCKARFVKAAIGLDCLMVDYLQLLPPGPGRRGETREAEVARVSRALKRLAQDLEVVVIAAAQLSRAPEQRKDGRPRLSDLRESGSQEQDADVVLLLHQEDETSSTAEVIVGKHRNRGRGSVKVRFEGTYHRFEDLSEDEV